MTALIADLRGGSIKLAMDTVTTNDTGTAPLRFSNKITLYPHRHMAICQFGHAAISNRWNGLIDTLAAEDIVQLDKIAPAELRRIHRYALLRGNLREHHSSTIYHFGYRPGLAKPRAFRYRSENAFASEDISGNSLITQPPVQLPIDAPPAFDTYIKAIQRQRGQSRQQGNPIYAIGGEIMCVEIKPSSITAQIIHRFDDFNETATLIANQVAERNQHNARIAAKPFWGRLYRWLGLLA